LLVVGFWSLGFGTWNFSLVWTKQTDSITITCNKEEIYRWLATFAATALTSSPKREIGSSTAPAPGRAV
jgi:hypothetical protein